MPLSARPVPGTRAEGSHWQWGQLSQPPRGAPRWSQADQLATVKATGCREKASVAQGEGCVREKLGVMGT